MFISFTFSRKTKILRKSYILCFLYFYNRMIFMCCIWSIENLKNMAVGKGSNKQEVWLHLWPLLLTWLNFNPSMDKYCPIVNWTPWNKPQWNINRNSYIFIQENAFQNTVCEMAAILSRPQCVNLSFTFQWPLLLTWFNFNPSMDK